MNVSSRNNYLLPQVKQVQIKSVRKELFPEFTKVYGTPSKIKTTIKSRIDKRGYAYDYSLELNYPGLKEEDFEQFHKMLQDRFEVKIKYTDNNVYSWSSKEFPLRLTTNFSNTTKLVFKVTSPIPAGISYTYGSSDYTINYYE